MMFEVVEVAWAKKCVQRKEYRDILLYGLNYSLRYTFRLDQRHQLLKVYWLRGS